MDITAHYFKFSSNWRGSNRLCGECALTYDAGAHIEIDRLKPYASYVCPSGGDLGHSSVWTGAYLPENRTTRDHICSCGQEFVEEDRESWLLTFEIQTSGSEKWSPVSVVRSKHAAQQQRDGLLGLIEQGEPIRNVELKGV